MTHAALDAFSITRHAADPRADGARRTVRISATAVTIERVLDGVRMRVGVPVAGYRGLYVAVQAPHGRAVLSLRHDDHELDVVLGSGSAADVARAARDWSRVLGLPVAVEDAAVRVGRAHVRDRKRTRVSRRSRFARRRQTGSIALVARSFASEHEIIAPD